MKHIRHILLSLLGLIIITPAYAVSVSILTNEEVTAADVSLLTDETKLFDVIKNGIALSMAQCVGDDPCTPDVNKDELQQIIDTLSQRVNVLSTRHEESGEEGLADVLIAYVDSLDSYRKYATRLNEILPDEVDLAADETFDEDDFFVEEARDPVKVIQDQYSMFADVEDEIEDDEDADLSSEDDETPAELDSSAENEESTNQ